MSRHEQLDKHPKSSWLRLPAWVRGYGDELLRHCDDSGLVCDSRDARDVALVIRAQPDEVDQLDRAITALLGQGFLSVGVNGLTISNYKTIRERRLSRDRQQKSRASRSVTPGHGSHETSHRGEERREEEIIEEDLPAPPSQDPTGTQAEPAPEEGARTDRFRESLRATRPTNLEATGGECLRAIKALGLSPAVVALRIEDHRLWCAEKMISADNWDAHLARWLRLTKPADVERASMAGAPPGRVKGAPPQGDHGRTGTEKARRSWT